MLTDHRHRTWLVLGAAVLAGSVTTAAAQPPAGSFDELSSTLQRGQKVAVTGVDGDTIKGKVIEITPGSLTLRVNEGFVEQPRTVARQDVVAIRRTDSVLNGFLIGLGAGIAANEVWIRQMCGPRGADDECTAIASLVRWSTFPAGGAAVGALIDRLIGNRPIYLAPGTRATLRVTPMLSRRAPVQRFPCGSSGSAYCGGAIGLPLMSTNDTLARPAS